MGELAGLIWLVGRSTTSDALPVKECKTIEYIAWLLLDAQLNADSGIVQKMQIKSCRMERNHE